MGERYSETFVVYLIVMYLSATVGACVGIVICAWLYYGIGLYGIVAAAVAAAAAAAAAVVVACVGFLAWALMPRTNSQERDDNGRYAKVYDMGKYVGKLKNGRLER